MSDCRLIVLSYGRPDLQITLKNMPKAVRQKVELWVVPSQYKAYKKNWSDVVKSVEAWPAHIDCVPKKRQWLARNIDSNYFLIDDDVGLYVWDQKEGRYFTAKDKPREFAYEFLEVLPHLYDHYDSVSACTKFMAEAQARKGLLKKDTVGFVVSGFRKGVIRRLEKQDKIWFNNTFMFTDIALPLQVLQATGKSVIYHGVAYNHSAVKALAGTGTDSYRDDFVKIDSAVKMARLFPGIVTGAKDTGNRGGGISLQKWFSRATKGVSDANVEASKAFVRQTCEDHGLVKPPKIFQYPDEMSRTDIIEEFKRRWNKNRKTG